MKIDFHTHTKLAKKMPFSQAYTDGIFREAKQAGLDALCLTEHYNGVDLIQSFEYVSKTMSRRGDCFIYDNENEAFGLKVFLGLEINAAEGGHFLVIGSLEEVQSIYNELGTYLQAKEHPPFEKLLAIVKSYSALFGVSHPFRESSKGNNMPDLPKELLRKLDFIDLNGKDCAFDRASTEIKVKALSKHLGVPILAGSDTHQSFQFGCIYNQFEESHNTVTELREAIKQGAYSIVHGESALMQVTAASIIKRTLKEIHALGGDYVSVLFEN